MTTTTREPVTEPGSDPGAQRRWKLAGQVLGGQWTRTQDGPTTTSVIEDRVTGWLARARRTRAAWVLRRYTNAYGLVSGFEGKDVATALGIGWLLWAAIGLLAVAIGGSGMWVPGIMLMVIGVAVTVAGIWGWGAYRNDPARLRHQILSRPGAARGREVARTMGHKAITAKIPTLRPGLGAAIAPGLDGHRPTRHDALSAVGGLGGGVYAACDWLTVTAALAAVAAWNTANPDRPNPDRPDVEPPDTGAQEPGRMTQAQARAAAYRAFTEQHARRMAERATVDAGDLLPAWVDQVTRLRADAAALAARLTGLVTAARRQGATDRLGAVLVPAAFAAAAEGIHQCTVLPRMLDEADHLHELLPEDAAFWLGFCRGERVYISIERPLYVVGPARSGKGVGVVIRAILDVPGAVVTTSTRTDNLEATIACRAARGPVAVFNPQQIGGLPHTLPWSPLEGCDNPELAQRRADVLVGGSGLGAGGQNAEWATSSGGIVEGLLHAAAIAGKTIDDVYDWAQEPSNAREAMLILRQKAAHQRYHRTIEAVLADDPRMRANQWFGVRNAFRPLSTAEVRSVFNVSMDDPDRFDTGEFLRQGGTVYMVSKPAGSAKETAGSLGVFFSLFLDHVTEVAETLGLASDGGRLDPPLHLVLDEMANIYPWAKALTMSSAGSGQGIQLQMYFQNRAQAVALYGEEGERTLWTNCAKLILGGDADEGRMADLTRLLGEREVAKQRHTWNTRSLGMDGSVSEEVQWRSLITSDELRRLPEGTGLLVDARARAMLVDLVPWWDTDHAEDITASLAWHRDHPGRVLGSSALMTAGAAARRRDFERAA